MKKIALAVLATGLLIAGLWWAIRRTPGAVPTSEENPTTFRVEAAEHGSLIRYDDPRTPLRSLRWLPPVQAGLVIVQVVTQSDRQQVAFFKGGTFQASYLVPKPLGVRDGFFRIAELRDTRVVEGDVAVLLYVAPGSGNDELPLLVALDLKTKEVRWFHRALGERLIMTEGPEGAIYLFGSKTPPVRLPLTLVSGERMSPAGLRSTANTIELPPEVLDITDLLPTGAWTFLLAHQGGLSAYFGSKGWQHYSLPEGDPGLFKDVRPTLGGGGKKYWWQPFPGRVIQVLADGTPKAVWADLPVAEPFAMDTALLHLLGVDADGKLWFDLAVPSPPLAGASTSGAEGKPQGISGAAETQDWPAYVGQGLDRTYCWDPQKKLLQRCQWADLTTPPGFPKPANGLRFAPSSGALLLDRGSSAWLLPLSALPLGAPSNTAQAR